MLGDEEDLVIREAIMNTVVLVRSSVVESMIEVLHE